MGLMGPNGSGKTTLLRIVSGVLRNYQGDLTLHSKNLSRFSCRELAQTVAVVPQEAHFAFPFSALEVVLMGRHPYQKSFAFDSSTDLEIAHWAMQKTDCAQFAARSVETLSGGEKQRVLLARALAQKPKLLLLDEPATHLDLKHQIDLFELLTRFNHEEGLTIFCVMHDLNMAARYCPNLMLLKNGRVVGQGKTDEMLSEKKMSEVFDVSLKKISTPDGGMCFVP